QIDWPVMNKPGGLKYFFEKNLFNDEDTLIFLDPDMIFVKAWDPKVEKGKAYGQKWKGYLKSYCQKISIQPELCPARDDECLMYPFVIKAGDMKKMSDDIEYFSRKGYFKCADWMGDMPAYVTAMVKHKLIVETKDNIGVCNNWDNCDDEEAPIMHYCQPIKDKNGEEIWDKRNYDGCGLPPDSSLATNRVDREVLKTLKEYILLKPKQINSGQKSTTITSLLGLFGIRKKVR
ncbi:MAG: hypothetical protein KAS01_03260, partial [Candidatus Pacebacteria bacterium]|nr:hypothetical protein [Candidatus Paceibacterota bacterium]